MRPVLVPIVALAMLAGYVLAELRADTFVTLTTLIGVVLFSCGVAELTERIER